MENESESNKKGKITKSYKTSKKENTRNMSESESIEYEKKIIFSLIIGLIILIIITSSLEKLLPKFYIDKINQYYSDGNYSKVAKYDTKLYIIEGYINNNDKYNEILLKVKESKGKKLIDKKEYKECLDDLETLKESNEIIKDEINTCKMELGKEAAEKQEYEEALKYFKDASLTPEIKEVANNCHYNMMLKYMEEKKYYKAYQETYSISNNDEEREKEILNAKYSYGMQEFNRKNYSSAIIPLEEVGDYEQARTYVNYCNIEIAEEYISDGKLNNATDTYSKIPDGIEFDGVKSTERKKQIKKYLYLMDITGKKNSTKNFCQTKNVWRYDGRWEDWHFDTTNPGEYIDTWVNINKDGTFKLSGTAKFYAYTDFSTLSEYCTPSLISKSFSIDNITSIPSNYQIDEYTKLQYSNGKFSIKYSKRDDYSTNFYNVYNTNITY